jgi:hypothetical protein
MLQMVSEPTLAVSRARTGQVRRKPGTFAKPPHCEHRQARGKMDWTICDNRKVEAEGISSIRYTRPSVGAFMECREPLSLFCLDLSCKRRSREL